MPTAIYKHGFGTAPFLAQDGLTLGLTENGFHTLEGMYYGNTTEPVSYSNLHFQAGFTVLGYPSMYISDVQMKQESEEVWAFTVQAKGLLGTQAVKRTISSRLQSYTTGSVTLPGEGTVNQAQGTYLKLTCGFNYISFYLPQLNMEPQNATPPDGTTLPSPPANPFSTTPTTTIYNYPNGWCRQGIDVEQISGAEIYLVKEDWEYIYRYQPG